MTSGDVWPLINACFLLRWKTLCWTSSEGLDRGNTALSLRKRVATTDTPAEGRGRAVQYGSCSVWEAACRQLGDTQGRRDLQRDGPGGTERQSPPAGPQEVTIPQAFTGALVDGVRHAPSFLPEEQPFSSSLSFPRVSYCPEVAAERKTEK